MKEETILEKFEDQEIAFDLFKGDLMVNATEMAKPFGKRVSNFTRLDQTELFIQALMNSQEFLEKCGFNYLTSETIKKSELRKKIIYTKTGRHHNGTYMCEELALQFAMWLSPEFNVWVIQTIQKIIFGNNPELVREAVMNMPRIQKELDRLRKKRNRLRNVILGDGRRKELHSLMSERASVNFQIKSLTEYSGDNPIFDNPEQLGRELVRLMKEKDIIQGDIQQKEESFNRILITDEYLDLVKQIGDLEREQRQYTRAIRYSEIKFSQN